MSRHSDSGTWLRRDAVLGLGGWLSLGAVALLALGGAARRPDGVALACPPLTTVAVVTAAVAVLSARLGLRSGIPGLGLLIAVPLPLLGLWQPALLALTGPPLLTPVVACLAFIMGREGLDRTGRWMLPVLILLYGGIALRVQQQVGAEGDEPQYLMVTESLLRDGDLALQRDFQEERYRAFTPRHLDPHFRVRGRHGEIFSLHAVGLSILILPAFAAFGYPGASLFMALLAALLAREIRELVNCWTGQARLSEGVGWIVGLSPPLIAYAGLIFTEIPAALAVAIVLRRAPGIREARRAWSALAVGTLIGALPWLNVRYAILSAVLLAFVASQRPRRGRVLAVVMPALVSAAGIALYHHVLYGFWDPRRVYGTTREFALSVMPQGLPGLFLDQEFGLLVYAPVFALAPLGIAALWRRSRALALACSAMALAVVLVAACWPMWRGGFNPPARFLVPILPVLALGVAAWLRRGLAVGPALLVGWGIWVGLAGGLEPHLVHRDRDGTAPLFRTEAGAYEWTHILPSYVLPPTEQAYARAYDDRHALSLVWIAGLLAACGLVRLRSRTHAAAAMGLGVAGLAAITGIAGALSTGRSQGRDAVRLLGREAWALPSGAIVSDARWDTSCLLWGPEYDPRRPFATTVAGRLPLSPGHYRISLTVERPPDANLPSLVATAEYRPGRVRQWSIPLSAKDDVLSAVFDVPLFARAVTLDLQGGSALLLRGAQLERE